MEVLLRGLVLGKRVEQRGGAGGGSFCAKAALTSSAKLLLNCVVEANNQPAGTSQKHPCVSGGGLQGPKARGPPPPPEETGSGV